MSIILRETKIVKKTATPWKSAIESVLIRGWLIARVVAQSHVISSSNRTVHEGLFLPCNLPRNKRRGEGREISQIETGYGVVLFCSVKYSVEIVRAQPLIRVNCKRSSEIYRNPYSVFGRSVFAKVQPLYSVIPRPDAVHRIYTIISLSGTGLALIANWLQAGQRNEHRRE